MVSSTRPESEDILGVTLPETGLIESPDPILNELKLVVGLGAIASLVDALEPTPPKTPIF
jgi:hypothetical protein